MGYDLSSRNKEAGDFYMGAFSWSWMINAGVGLVIGTGPAKNPASYSYTPDAKGASPQTNDGYRVTAEQARMMAAAARGLVNVERFIAKEWEQMSEEDRKLDTEWNERSKIYRTPVRDDFIDKAAAFAEWAEKSGGFAIW